MPEIELMSIEEHSATACRDSTQSSTDHQFTTQSQNSQNFVIQIEPRPQEMQDRPAPALPANRFSPHQSTTQSSTAHPSATHSTATQFPQAQEPEEYLIPLQTQSTASIYSYAYDHMVARIMHFLSLQHRGRLVTTTAEIHHHQPQNAHAERNSVLTQESVASTRNSSVAAQDSLASNQLFLPEESGVQMQHNHETSSNTDSDYLEGFKTPNETPNGLFEQIDGCQRISSVSEGTDNREIVMMVSNV